MVYLISNASSYVYASSVSLKFSFKYTVHSSIFTPNGISSKVRNVLMPLSASSSVNSTLRNNIPFSFQAFIFKKLLVTL